MELIRNSVILSLQKSYKEVCIPFIFFIYHISRSFCKNCINIFLRLETLEWVIQRE